uniref:Uncharacterized protein n=1 Tax=Opuntia streptacantha TaxID=393608 RepID=A0A7C9DLA2_OPUST
MNSYKPGRRKLHCMFSPYAQWHISSHTQKPNHKNFCGQWLGSEVLCKGGSCQSCSGCNNGRWALKIYPRGGLEDLRYKRKDTAHCPVGLGDRTVSSLQPLVTQCFMISISSLG